MDELKEIAGPMLDEQEYRPSSEAEETFEEYLKLRMQQPSFSNARSVRNALDRVRLLVMTRSSARQCHGPSSESSRASVSSTP